MPKRTLTTLTKRQIDAIPPGVTIWDSQVPGFGVRTMTSGLKSFIFQFRTKAGEQGRITVGRYPATTVDEARKRARSLRTIVDDGGNPSRDRRAERNAATVAELAEYYVGEYAQARDLKAQSIKECKSLLERLALPSIGHRKVEDITITDIRKLHGHARNEAGKYSANRLRAVLSKMFNLAIEREWRSDNPCSHVQRFPEDKRQRFLSQDEVTRLLSACDRYEDQEAANAVRLLLFTGARLREVLKAAWPQFDLERGIWEKPSHHTKTKIRHQVYLAEPVVALLRRMYARRTSNEFLVPGLNNRPRCDLKRPWAAIQHDAALEDIRLHDLRRTYASFMLSGGADLSAVGKALGHTQASTTQRYAFLLTDVQKEAANRAVAKMGGLRIVA